MLTTKCSLDMSWRPKTPMPPADAVVAVAARAAAWR